MALAHELTPDRCMSAIAEHSAGLAAAADGRLDAPVEFCPGWTVRDLLHHVTRVHWFWATIVEEGLQAPPEDSRRPGAAPDGTVLETFSTGAERLVRVLGAADPGAPCWTWAPTRQDAAFVIRHQVQEAAVHHWDAAHAAGRGIDIAPEVAGDSVDEFLGISVSNLGDPADPLPPALDGRFALRCTDAEEAWVVADGSRPGLALATRTTAADVEAGAVPAVSGTAGQLLLWLYDRHGDPSGEADTTAVDVELLARFRALCFTA